MNRSKEAALALLRKYLEDDLSEAESKELFGLLQTDILIGEPVTDDLLRELYNRSFQEKKLLSAKGSNQIWQRLLESVESKPAMPPNEMHLAGSPEQQEQEMSPVPVRKVGWWKYVAAAAVIVCFGTAVWYWNSGTGDVDQHPETAIAKTSARTPFANSSTLQLPDGRNIPLDSVSGNILEAGQLTVTNSRGLLQYSGVSAKAEQHTITVPRGRQYQLVLPDGTKVWLNAASVISYPTLFSGNNRKVTVSGEAYFEVVSDKDRPFIADVRGRAMVEVLGTRFNVNAYEDVPYIYTTLLQGSVRVGAPGTSVLLKPGEQAQMEKGVVSIIEKTDPESTVSWKNGFFHFERTKIEEVMRQLARWYDIEVEYENEIPSVVFSGEISRKLNWQEALTVLSSLGLRFRNEGSKIIIAPKSLFPG